MQGRVVSPNPTILGKEKKRTSVPCDDWHILDVRWPAKRILIATELLQLHRQLPFLDLVVGENLQVASKTEKGARSDEPLRRVVLVPLDGIPVVHRELVMKIVVTFTDSDEGSDDMIAGRVLVVKGSVTEPMRERVHTESRLHYRRRQIRECIQKE